MPAKEIRLQVSYGTMNGLHWINQAVEQQIPILALHGWLDNANSFVPIAEHLMQVNSEMIALDLAGHGCSDHRAVGSQYHFVDYVFDVLDAVNKIGWDRIILLGHSMGAGVASLIAAIAPEKVHQLILIDGIGPLSSPVNEVTSQLKKSIDLHHRLGSRLKHITYPDWNLLIERRAAIGNISFPSAELLITRNTRIENGKIFWLADQRLKLLSPVYLDEQQVLSFLSNIQAKTLLVKASHGLLSERPSSRQRMLSIQDLQVVEVVGGHHLHMETPETVAKELIEFLATEI